MGSHILLLHCVHCSGKRREGLINSGQPLLHFEGSEKTVEKCVFSWRRCCLYSKGLRPLKISGRKNHGAVLRAACDRIELKAIPKIAENEFCPEVPI